MIDGGIGPIALHHLAGDGEEVLLVAPAVAHRWIAGDEGLRVTGLPTRWRRVDFTIRGDADAVEAHLRLPEGFAAQVRLRLPTPAGRVPTSVQVNGQSAENLLTDGCIVALPPDSVGEITVTATL